MLYCGAHCKQLVSIQWQLYMARDSNMTKIITYYIYVGASKAPKAVSLLQTTFVTTYVSS